MVAVHMIGHGNEYGKADYDGEGFVLRTFIIHRRGQETVKVGYGFGQGQSTGKLTGIDGHDRLDGRRAGNQMRRVAIRGNRSAEEHVMQKGRIGPCGLLLWN